MQLWNLWFSQRPVAASRQSYYPPLIRHGQTCSRKYLNFRSKREKDWITDWHNNSRKQSGVREAGQICGHMGWCNEKQNFLTAEQCDPPQTLKPCLPVFWQGSHRNKLKCLHIHTQTHTQMHNVLPPASLRILADYLNFSVRAVYLGSIDQMSDVISPCLVHTDYCSGYWCPQLKAHFCLITN